MTIETTAEQDAALVQILDWLQDPDTDQRVMSLSGPAGTGKTTLLGLIRTAIVGDPCQLFWAATTGKAAHQLKSAVKRDVATLHSLLYWPPRERPDHLAFTHVRPFPGVMGDVVIIDEASMVTQEIHETIENEWVQGGARVLYVGDGYQLPPVNSDFSIFHETKGPKLEDVYRNDDSILFAATYLRETGRVLTDCVGTYEFRTGNLRDAVGDYLADPEDHALITWRNKIRMMANDYIRRQQGRRIPRPEPGEPVLFCKSGQGVVNGEIATVASLMPYGNIGKIHAYSMVDTEGNERLVSIDGRTASMDGYLPALPSEDDYKEYLDDVKALSREHKRETGEWGDFRPVPITWAYCLTAHKAQGSEFDRVTVYLTNWDTTSRPFKEMTTLPNGERMSFAARWCYTALTRAKKRASIVIGG